MCNIEFELKWHKDARHELDMALEAKSEEDREVHFSNFVGMCYAKALASNQEDFSVKVMCAFAKSFFEVYRNADEEQKCKLLCLMLLNLKDVFED